MTDTELAARVEAARDFLVTHKLIGSPIGVYEFGKGDTAAVRSGRIDTSFGAGV